jgi:hypothetical protein
MLTDTTMLIDEAIERLELLRGVFADDVAVCRRAGLLREAQQCGDALDAIAQVLPRLADARATQDIPLRFGPGVCVHCD